MINTMGATMADFLMTHQGPVRLAFFLTVLGAVAMWEVAAPKRKLVHSKAVRWAANLGVVGVNVLVVGLLVPITAVATALLAQERGWGLLNNVDIHPTVGMLLAILALDCIIYLQHVMFHAVPVLWRLHRMHHADTDYDVSLGLRFHPLEVILSLGIKLAAIVLLGPTPVTVIVFEVILNGTAMFNHGNVRMPLGLDRVLRLVVVTPDMHRVHHSILPGETNSNFGFNLPWWDRLFGTYKAQPKAGHEGMTLGLNEFRDPKYLTLPWLLEMPFEKETGSYAINREEEG